MAKKSNNDPTQDRLAQVEQSDLGESQLNEEFVDWLKKWGNQILLAILVVALLAVGWQWLVRTKMETRDAAWSTLESAQLPASLEEVAASSEGVDSITPLALMRAGDQYLRSVQTGTRFDREPTAEDYSLDDDTRTLFLQRANTLYAEAIVAVGTEWEQVFAKKLLVISALFGQAAVAESQGKVEEAKTLLTRIGTIAEPEYPDLAAQATARSENLDVITTKVSFPLASDLPQPPPAETLPDPTELLGTGALLTPVDGDAAGDATAETDPDSNDDASTLILQGGSGTTEAPGDGSD
ncbi:MAG: hypothetical protein VX641_04290 [Planctomycetota bacterium]|nr:hypothetical protein [Planctomycetota bacterium]